MKEKILEVKAQAEHIASLWNGKNPGIDEDRAMIALEVIEKCDQLLNLVEEL